MKKAKIFITVILITGLMLLVTLLAAVIMLTIVYEAGETRTHGILSVLAFLMSAVIFGTCMNKVINRIKRLWE